MNQGKSFFRIYFDERIAYKKVIFQIFPKTSDNFNIWCFWDDEKFEEIFNQFYLEITTSNIPTLKEAYKLFTKFQSENRGIVSLIKFLVKSGYKLGEFERFDLPDGKYNHLVVTTDNVNNNEFEVWEYGKEANGYHKYGYFAGTKNQAKKYIKDNYKESKEGYSKYRLFLKGYFTPTNLNKQISISPILKLV